VAKLADCAGELERKIVLVVDAALQQQLQSWQRKPPVPSASFKAIGKQLAKLLEAIQVRGRGTVHVQMDVHENILP
jgi:hypothetical protein